MQSSLVRRVFLLVLAIIIIVAGWFIYDSYQRRQMMAREEANYRTQLKLVNADVTTAPDFVLTDQHGKKIALHDFKGKVVVLSFMDPECTDICPILSAEIVRADDLMGAAKSNVVFLAVNVNQYHASQQDMLQYSKEHNLNSLPNWHFLTGTTQELQAVWKAYGILVKPSKTGDVEHSSFVYFIDKNGQEKYIANPDNDKSSIETWAKGVNFFTAQLI